MKEILRDFPDVTANTYVDHPWPGWDGRSVDFWGPGGRGHAIDVMDGYNIRRRLMRKPGEPHIRHWIYRHTLWTSFGGYQHWEPDDHSFGLRHLHVTYW